MARYFPVVARSGWTDGELSDIENLFSGLPRSTQDHTQIDREYRAAAGAWLPALALPTSVHERLSEIFAVANGQFGMSIDGIEESIAMMEYSDGGFFDWHTDCVNGITTRRKLSMSLLLSTPQDFSGGDLEFCPGGLLQQEIRKGSAVVFPSFYAHRVTPVVSGTRKALVCWMSGAPLR
jgi:PKHD-type hydroxylase